MTAWLVMEQDPLNSLLRERYKSYVCWDIESVRYIVKIVEEEILTPLKPSTIISPLVCATIDDPPQHTLGLVFYLKAESWNRGSGGGVLSRGGREKRSSLRGILPFTDDHSWNRYLPSQFLKQASNESVSPSEDIVLLWRFIRYLYVLLRVYVGEMQSTCWGNCFQENLTIEAI